MLFLVASAALSRSRQQQRPNLPSVLRNDTRRMEHHADEAPAAEGEVVSQGDVAATARSIFGARIPFNQVLGLEIESVEPDRAVIRVPMRDELIGNFTHGTLHGGVTSAVLDVAGGLAAFVGLLRRTDDQTEDEIRQRFGKLGTIDLRVDFLQPGRGRFFRAGAYILRIGNRVAVTRMELHNDEGELIATGTGAYTIG